MSENSSLYSLLKSFATHQNSGLLHLNDFSDYVRHYAQKHAAENPALNSYLGQSQDQMNKELSKLESQKKVRLINSDGNYFVVLISFYAEKVAARYTDITNNAALSFPTPADLPKKFPDDALESATASEVLVPMLEGQLKSESPVLYSLSLPRELPSLLYSSLTEPETLLEISLAKMRIMLSQDEYHDYFLKKLKISNPGKEISIKNFFTQFITKPVESLESLKNSGDVFFFWSQLCFFIRQDYDKVKDYTAEDISLLQSVFITEISNTFFKNRAQQNMQRSTALKNLEQNLSKPPYYFNRDAIIHFVDSRGVPLLGQYTEEDLNNFLHDRTTNIETNDLPELLTFRTVGSEQRYYITKQKVLPLIVRLCSDARDTVRDNLTKEWFNHYKQFETVPEMNDQKAFEKRLEKEVRSTSPILYALLNSNFLSLVHYESRMSHDPATDKINLFSDGKLVSYSELLLMQRHEISTDARILLPFWYTTPIISWFAALFLGRTKKERRKEEEKRPVKATSHNAFEDEEENETFKRSRTRETSSQDRKKDLVAAAKKVEAHLVPQGSTLEREMSAYIHQWNRMLDKKNAEMLTEDVNSLIRDYMRKTLRTLTGSGMTVDRIENLATTLVKTPALSKIKDQEQLTMYVELYMVQIVKNL